MKFNGLTFEDIIKEFKVLCKEGLSPSGIIKFRRAIKELSKKMHTDSKTFRKPVATELSIEIKVRKIKEKPEKKSKKPKKKKEPEETTNNEDIPAVKHILNG